MARGQHTDRQTNKQKVFLYVIDVFLLEIVYTFVNNVYIYVGVEEGISGAENSVFPWVDLEFPGGT